MRTVLVLGILAVVPCLPASGQSVAADTFKYDVVDRQGHHRVLERVEYEIAPDGRQIPRKVGYTEMAAGLHYKNERGEWQDSKEEIEILANGAGAAARQGQHKVYFAPDIAAVEVIDFETPDGKRLRSRVFGLSYFDTAKGEAVLIGAVKSTEGELAAANRVVYPNAFDGIEADVEFIYTLAGFEQNIVLRAQLPTPDALGLNPETTILQVLTEFFEPPTPTKQEVAQATGLADETLSFGEMTMTRGRAFSVGEASESRSVPVSKRWITLDNSARTFLVEEVPLTTVESQINALPPKRRQASLDPGRRGKGDNVIAALSGLFAKRTPPTPTAKMRLAMASGPRDGFVLDYTINLTSATNFTFKGDTTHYVSGTVNLSGVTTIEGGTVIKFSTNTSAQINLLDSLICKTGPYRPAIFTAKDDNSVGETISGSTGNPLGHYGGAGLVLPWSVAPSVEVGGVRFAHLRTGLDCSVGGDAWLHDLQFVSCRYPLAVAGGNSALFNVLIYDADTAIYGGGNAAATHVTVSKTATLADDNIAYGSFLTTTNCLFVSVTNLGNYSLETNYTAVVGTATGLFQTVNGGAHYLATNSPYRNIGTTNISAELLAGLKFRTTYPPIAFTNVTSTYIELGPQAQRDTDVPDLGYHYDPLDYIFGKVDQNTNLTFAAGTAVGWFRHNQGWTYAGHGIHIADTKTVTFAGTATEPCWFVHQTAVQESLVGYTPIDAGPGGITGWATSKANQPYLNLRFTKFAGLPIYRNHIRDDNGAIMVTANHCEFYGGGLGGYVSSLAFTNCLLDRTGVWLSSGNTNYNDVFAFRNCTVRGGYFAIARQSGNIGHVKVTVLDSAFELTDLYPPDPHSANASLTHYDYNAYLSGGETNLPSGAHDFIVTNFNWQTGWYGNFYLPTNSPLINTGSVTNAALLGLYHFTVTTNQVKEATSRLDVGYHYVATDGSGIPVDTDGDSIPDYLDPIPWVRITSPATGTLYAASPTNILITANAHDDGYITKVEFYSGNTKIGEDTTEPYSLTWSNIGAGFYSLTARATDNNATISTSSVVNVSVTAVIAKGATWKYLDNGSNQGTNWREPSFNDSAWASGPAELGYGDGGEATVVSYGPNSNNKYITTYFRRTFTVQNPEEFSGMVMWLQRDDGAVVYVNGVEVRRDNMPSGSVSYTNLASSTVDGSNESTFFTTPLDTDLLVSGTNVMAVEIHQVSGTSSDISFNLELKGDVYPPTISWVSPTNGSTFNASTNITLTAQAADDTGVRRVVFYGNGIRVGETLTGTSGQYSIVWSNAPAGLYQMTAKAVDLIGQESTSTQLINITVRSNALLVVTNSTTLTTAEVAVSNRLAGMGFVVTKKSGSSAVTADAYGKTVVVISSTVPSTDVNTKFRDVTTPVVTWDHSLYDDFGMTDTSSSAHNNTNGQTLLTIATPTHPLAAGLSGTLQVASSAGAFAWGVPGSNAVIIATLTNDSSKALIFGYEKNSLMKNGQAAQGRRVGFFMTDATASSLTANGWALFDAAILWAAEYPCFPALDVMLVLDRSSSMNGQPLVDAKAASSDFVNLLQTASDQAGVVSFASNSTLHQTLTNHSPTLIQAINSITNLTGSRIDLGIETAQQELVSSRQNTNALAVMVLLSDGKPSGTTIENVLAKATLAKNAGTRIITVGFGSVNAANLQAIASSPSDFYHTPESSGLSDLYDSIAASLCRDVPTNLPPTVTIINPVNGQLFLFSPTNILLQATASDPDGTVANVTFYEGNDVLGVDATPPYEFLWENVPWASNYTVKAVATDNHGASVTNSVTITVNAMPAVNITSPTNLQSFLEVTNITISANATDNDGSITNVAFYSGTNLLGNDTSSPYSVVWNNRTNNFYPVHAIATDNRGASSTSPLVVFEVAPTNTPPSVWIAYPTNNEVFRAGADITITASATNGSGTVTNVEFFVDGQWSGNDPADPYSLTICCWKAGSYELVAKATDNLGRSAVSAPIKITVTDPAVTSGSGFWDPTFRFPEDAGFYGIWALRADGSNLYVGGDFNVLALQSAGVLKWDGTNWAGLGILRLYVNTIAVDGTNLYAGGSTVSGATPYGMAKWDGGTSWVQVGNGLPETATVWAIEVVGSDLYVGGDFTSAGGDTNVQYIARLNRNTSEWEAVGDGLNGPVYAISSIGNRIFIGGAFTNAGASTATYVAELRANQWTNLGVAVGGTNSFGEPGRVYALATCDTNLFVGGDFTSAGGNSAARGIARWDGKSWFPINSGLAPNTNSYVWYTDVQTNLAVYSISTRGDSIFAGGVFRGAVSGENTVPAYQIAKATWSEVVQDWLWVDLDLGVFYGPSGDSPGGGEVYATAIMEGATPNSYEVFIGGDFWLAGSSQKAAHNLARWSVGRPYPTNAPSVSITVPANNTVFTNPAAITFEASATTGENDIWYVEFFVNGQSVGSDSDYPYTTTWNSPEPGAHLVSAIVVDYASLKNSSAVVPFSVVDTNESIVAKNDVFTIFANSAATRLPVLTNDSPLGELKISQGSHSLLSAYGNSRLGNVTVSHDQQELVYTPYPDTYGTNTLWYQVTNQLGAGEASVTVYVRSKPQIEILSPDCSTCTVTSPVSDLTISGSTRDWDGTVASVALFTNGVQFGSPVTPTGTNYSFTWSTSTPGYYQFIAVATDNDGYTNASIPVTLQVRAASSPNPPVAAIASPAPSVTYLATLPITNSFLIRDGQLALTGSAYDPDAGDSVGYQILLLDPQNPDGPPLFNVTPGTLNSQGFNESAVTNASLGTVDLSVVDNGTYILALLVRGGGDESTASLPVAVDSNLKIGQFSFSEQDMVIPVNGIPLTVVRTYNSLNPRVGDFGRSWTYTLNSLDVSLDEMREKHLVGSERLPIAYDEEEDENGLPLNLGIRVGGGRDVTLTLPDGRRTTFQFYFDGPHSCDGDAYGEYCYEAKWQAPPGIDYELTAIGSPVYNALSGYWNNEQGTGFESYDFSGFILKAKDGTTFNITRGSANDVIFDETGEGHYINVRVYGPPKLTSIVQRTGDWIEISDGGLFHYNATNGLTRSVLIERDIAGRIAAIRDPNSGSNGLPVVKYIYHRELSNLLQVQRLIDRNAGTYSTTKYHYDHPKFPHYITSIEDPRGIPIARNLYDDVGRLIGVIDSAGRTNRFEHDISGRREIHYDRGGNATTYRYDTRGNVTEVVNALNHTNQFLYDGDGYLTNSVDALGHVTVYTNDIDGNVLSVTVPYPAGAYPSNYTTHFTYNEFGEQTSVRLPTGAVITNVFNPTNGLLTAVKDGDGNIISATEYNALGLPAVETDLFGALNYVYDATGNLAHMTNSLNKVVSSLYDPNGNLTNLVDGSSTTTVAYDAMNREMMANYGNGIWITNTYENEGDWSSVDGPTIGHMERRMDDQGRLAGWETANGSTPGFAYDVNGRLEYETNSIGVVTRTIYNEAGWVKANTNLATGAWTAFGYDAAGQRTAVTNALGIATRYAYYPSGSLKAMTNAFGTNAWLYSDAAGACAGCGNAVSVTDPFGRVTESIASPYGLPVSTVWRSGSLVSSNSIEYLEGLTTPEQEAEEYPVAITDEGNRTRRYDYDDLGRLYRATDLSGATWWTNQFDPDTGALTNVLSPTGESLRYTYDELDNVATIRFGDNNWLTNFYNAENRLSGVRLPTGVQWTNHYDFAGRLTNRQAKVGGVVTETASFEYNGNDAVTKMTDNTGSTTNLFDAAGRLWGIDYPSGASVRYQLDVLGRIVGITNKASSGGTAYVTRYQYDPVGNVSTVIDPFDGETHFEYDRVGRRTKRTLPNSVVTEWKYDWRDRVTNITHKISSTTLASVVYERATGGEPTKITREDGTHVELKYDTAWRLTNEVFYAGGSPQTTNSYAYDASGSRIKLVKGNVTYTNAVSGGYQITAVKNAANGNTTNSYAYDAGGRVTSINRDGAILNLGYNTADQVRAVTNGANWVTYAHDASGRRTFSTNNTSVRKFLVAPTPGSDLESPHLVANASGSVQQGYVYLGDDPILRYSTNGTAGYYLEDGMGSIIGIAPASSPGTGNTTRLFYDGFGNARATNGPAPAIPSGTGGDFRFHGAWLEEQSGLYHLRAREYDARLGRFTSRDPRPGEFNSPETQHPYAYALNNPSVFIDPSGEENLISLTTAQFVQLLLQTLRQIALYEIKQEAKRQIAGAAFNFLVKELLAQYVPNGAWNTFLEKGIFAGNKFSDAGRKAFCKLFKDSEWAGRIHFEVNIRDKGRDIGDPADNGVGCSPGPKWDGTVKPLIRPGHSRPDFIFGNPPRIAAGVYQDSYLVGDFKLTTSTLYRDYIQKHNIDQFNAIRAFAKKHTTSKTAVFLVLSKDPKLSAAENTARIQYMKKLITARLMRKGVIGGVFVIRG